jgi:hypothetical protein
MQVKPMASYRSQTNTRSFITTILRLDRGYSNPLGSWLKDSISYAEPTKIAALQTWKVHEIRSVAFLRTGIKCRVDNTNLQLAMCSQSPSTRTRTGT